MKNIKSLFSGLLLFAYVVTMYGQANKFDMGAEGSTSVIFLRGNEVIRQIHKPAVGFLGGLFFQYNFKMVISLRTGIAYERKGSVVHTHINDSNGNPTGRGTLHTNFDYLTFPLLVRATFGRKVQYFVNAGPYFGYLLRQTFVTRGANIPTTTRDNTYLDKRFDTGISTGIGISVPLGTAYSFSFELKNNLGLYNVSAVPVINNGTIKTNSTNVLFSFSYKPGQRTTRVK